jgi:hypothetical protein
MSAERTLEGKSLNRLENYLVSILCLLPVVISFIYVYLYGVNVVYCDAWDILPIFEKYYAGSLTFSDLYAQVNAHRFFFPRLIMLSLGILTGYNNLVEMYVVIIFFVLVLALLFLAFKRQFNIKTTAWWFVPVPFLVFSLVQYENMLFGVQLSWALAQLAGVLTLYLISLLPQATNTKTRHLIFLAALMGATVASFSVVMGLWLWFLGVMLIAIIREKRVKIYYLGIWAVVGVGEWFFYFLNFKNQGHPNPFYVMIEPLRFIQYVVTSLGGSLFWDIETASIAGALIVVLLSICLFLLLKNKRFRENSFWIALAGFSILTMITIAIGRASHGVDQGLSSRYTSFSLLAVIAVYFMFLDFYNQERSFLTGAGVALLIGFIILSVPLSYLKGYIVGNHSRHQREREAFILYTYESQPDELLKKLHPGRLPIRKNALFLQQKGYNVFSQPSKFWEVSYLTNLPVVASPPTFAVETINDRELVPAKLSLTIKNSSGFIMVRGWAVDSKAQKPAAAVYLEIDGKLYPAFLGLYRKDIKERFQNRAYRFAGFERALPLSEIGPGPHALTVKILTHDKKACYRPEQSWIFEIK